MCTFQAIEKEKQDILNADTETGKLTLIFLNQIKILKIISINNI